MLQQDGCFACQPCSAIKAITQARGKYFSMRGRAAARDENAAELFGHPDNVRIGERMTRSAGKFQRHATFSRTDGSLFVNEAGMRQNIYSCHDGGKICSFLHIFQKGFSVCEYQTRSGFARIVHGFREKRRGNMDEFDPKYRFNVRMQTQAFDVFGKRHKRGHVEFAGTQNQAHGPISVQCRKPQRLSHRQAGRPRYGGNGYMYMKIYHELVFIPHHDGSLQMGWGTVRIEMLPQIPGKSHAGQSKRKNLLRQFHRERALSN